MNYDVQRAAEDKEAASRQVHWCLGMYASASTWLYNVVHKICAAQEPKQTIQTHFFLGKNDCAVLDQPGLHIVKSHEIADESTVINVAKNAQTILITIRDPRDAVTSLMQYHGYMFDRALPLVEAATNLCLQFATDKRALLWRFEDSFFEKRGTLEHIAAHIGVRLNKFDQEAIFSAMRRPEIEKFISNLKTMPGVLQDRVSGDLLDPKTHWHTHHAGRSGEIGRWRHMLTKRQVTEVEQRLRNYYKLII